MGLLMFYFKRFLQVLQDGFLHKVIADYLLTKYLSLAMDKVQKDNIEIIC